MFSSSYESGGGRSLEAVGPNTYQPDARHSDLLKTVQQASAELAGVDTVTGIAEAALRIALKLTNSSVAFLTLVEDGGEAKRLFSLARDADGSVASQATERILAGRAIDAAGLNPAIRSTCTETLVAGGRELGVFGVSGPIGYTAAQLGTFAIFAGHVASSIGLARLSERRQQMVDTVVNLRADLERSERQRLINDERARGAERVERAHEAAVDALLAVSRHARTGHELADFYHRLTASIAELVKARKVLFWKLTEEGTLEPIPGGHGINAELLAQITPSPCAADRDDIASRVVFQDLMFRAPRIDEAGDRRPVLEALQARNVIAVPWRAGDQRLGMVAAYDSRREGGFSREDAWVLQKAGLAAGLVWQLKYAEADLKKTVERLEKVDAARQLLLKNVSTAVEKDRKRFAGELHDDALQKLTAAELQLQRVQEPTGEAAELLTEARDLLSETEEALRRLLFEVRPPALEARGGFDKTLGERIRMLRSLTGAEVEVDMDMPDDLSFEFRSMLFRQVTEALANVEKHAAATRVKLSLRLEDGGVHGLVEDNGCGFVVSERDRLPGHLGLLALHERALLAGGWNKTESEPGRGTKVDFWFPISESRLPQA